MNLLRHGMAGRFVREIAPIRGSRKDLLLLSLQVLEALEDLLFFVILPDDALEEKEIMESLSA